MEMYYALNGKYPDLSAFDNEVNFETKLINLNSALGNNFHLNNIFIKKAENGTGYSIILTDEQENFQVEITQDNIGDIQKF